MRRVLVHYWVEADSLRSREDAPALIVLETERSQRASVVDQNSRLRGEMCKVTVFDSPGLRVMRSKAASVRVANWTPVGR